MDEINRLTLPSEPITKKALASFIGVSERTIYNYTCMASQFVDDFLGDYPSLNGRYITAMPLTSYQAWVLTQIHEFLGFFCSSKLLEDRLENDRKIQQSFSKYAFLGKFPEYSEPGSIVRLQP
jgi:hypothetical protein